MQESSDLILEEPLVKIIRLAVLQWYDQEGRPLPWRIRSTEYSTVISEFMLQQTQVAAVIPYYEEFMKKFPTFRRLALATEEEVLQAWSGLGYYRRARMLKRLAEIVVRDYKGRLPHDPKVMATLPGFGEYTVGAVGSIAFNMRLPLVDGNVRRVMGRLFALEGDLTRGAGKKRLWDLCGQVVDPFRPGDFNQGLMDLGATVCLPREPLCLICPVFEQCRARAIGFPESFPAAMSRPKVTPVREVAVALVRQGKVLVVQRGDGGSFAGMWELPRMDTREVFNEAELTPSRVLFDLLRLRRSNAELIGQAVSTFTHHRIKTELYRIEDRSTEAVRRQRHVAHRWISPRNLKTLASSRAQRRLFEMLAEKKKPSSRAGD